MAWVEVSRPARPFQHHQGGQDEAREQELAQGTQEMETFVTDAPALSKADLESFYGKDVVGRLYAMLDYCKDKGLPVVLCTVPSREGTMEFSRIKGQGTNLIQRQLQSTAREYGCHYFDGYQPFLNHTPEAIRDQLWLKYDGHWSQRGSDQFAEKLAEFLEQHWGKREPS